MSLALVFDTETTGLPLWNEPSEDPRQPHIVQLAACLVDLDTRKVASSINLTVKPDGWTIPDEVAAIHGITTAHANEIGVPEDDVLALFIGLWNQRLRIAHNESFDARIIRIALKRFEYDEVAQACWKDGKSDCTQRLATPILKLPPTGKMLAAGFNKFKSANLREAFQHFMGREMQNAHSAMGDVQACMAVYFAIKGPPK